MEVPILSLLKSQRLQQHWPASLKGSNWQVGSRCPVWTRMAPVCRWQAHLDLLRPSHQLVGTWPFIITLVLLLFLQQSSMWKILNSLYPSLDLVGEWKKDQEGCVFQEKWFSRNISFLKWNGTVNLLYVLAARQLNCGVVLKIYVPLFTCENKLTFFHTICRNNLSFSASDMTEKTLSSWMTSYSL